MKGRTTARRSGSNPVASPGSARRTGVPPSRRSVARSVALPASALDLHRALLALASLLALLALLLPAAAAADEAPAWRTLESLRGSLEEASPLAAGFTQEFLPAGFESGERESGRLALDLPACLRFDYDEPFPKSYLLCGHVAHTWNPGETSGRRYLLAEADEPGLDLLRLDVELLRGRYSAELTTGDAGTSEVELTPLEPLEITRATLTVDTAAGRLAALAYEDVEGNRTLFEFSDFAALTEPAAFAPPELAWLEN